MLVSNGWAPVRFDAIGGKPLEDGGRLTIGWGFGFLEHVGEWEGLTI